MRILVDVPGVAGTSTFEGFVNQIECQSLSYERRVRDANAAAPPAVKPPHRPIVLVKSFDKSTPGLGDAAVKPTVFPKVTITCGAEEGTRITKHLVFELGNAQVRKIEHSISDGGSPLPVERLELIYTSLSITYSPPGVSPKAVTA